ncbi:2-hydroxymuconate tautomerase [Indiicoccus explosivorum]|uniref:2-hydroxymuconate tautomerase n=1 Tax=Indiicoccus explosivorum TaxID=1917864 RepID=UPI000B436348|nr:2-hydroxymuconate tautomerase [Indiicoccus explosivorum]
MPIIHVTLLEGREQQAIETCIQQVTRTVHESLGAPLSSIRVIVNEVPRNRYAVGGTLKSEIPD